MRDQQLHAQRVQLFLGQLVIFTAIFLFLGVVLFHLIQQSMYQNEDQQLLRQSQNMDRLEKEIVRQTQDKGERLMPPPLDSRQEESFQIQTVIWSEDGTIVNQEALGERYYIFSELTLKKEELNTIREIKLTQDHQDTLFFRSITKKVTLPSTQKTYYVQTLVNTNQIQETIRQVLKILVFSLILCEIVSISLSMYLSKRNMKPIIESWQKQQDFVEDAAHEMRTPLTIIQNQLEKLLIQPENTIMDHSSDIGSALSETRRLTHLTNDLLLLTRQGDDRTAMLEEVQLTEFLNELVEPYQEVAAFEDKTLTLIDETYQQSAMIDVMQVRQLCVILIDNAMKYTSEGDAITIHSRLIKKGEWQVSVSDTGCGIQPENQEKIFDRFYREDEARQKTTGGYGLGLAIAKKIVENNQGKISVQSNVPKGSIFTFSLKTNEKTSSQPVL